MRTRRRHQRAVHVEIDAELFERLLAYCQERGIDLDAVIESRCELHLARADAGLVGLHPPCEPWEG